MKCFMVLVALIGAVASSGLIADDPTAPIGDLIPERYGYAGYGGYAGRGLVGHGLAGRGLLGHGLAGRGLLGHGLAGRGLVGHGVGLARGYGGYAAGPVVVNAGYGGYAAGPVVVDAGHGGYAAGPAVVHADHGYGPFCAGKSDGYYPDGDCGSYHQCSNGIDNLRPCPYGLNWSQAALRCVYPSQSECGHGYAAAIVH